MLLTLGSQVLSAGSSVLLHFLGLRTADTYSVAAQIGLTGFTGVTVGILYNIAIGRPGFTTWRRWSTVASLVSVTASLVQGAILTGTGFTSSHGVLFVWTVFIVFGVSGALIAIAATEGVREACEGRPMLFASVTVLPNTGYAVGILAAAVTHELALPAVGWLIGSVALYLVSRRARPGASEPEVQLRERPEASDAIGSQVSGLVVGVVSSTFMPMLFLAALTQLTVGVVYIATLLARIVNASVALTVNSVLLVRFNWTDQATGLGRTTAVAGTSFVVGMLTVVGLKLTGGAAIFTDGVMVAGWLVGVIASAIVTRHLNAGRHGRLVLVKSVVELVVTGSAAAALFLVPSFVGYFACFAVSAALTLVFGGLAFQRRLLVALGVVGLISCAAVIITGRS